MRPRSILLTAMVTLALFSASNTNLSGNTLDIEWPADSAETSNVVVLIHGWQPDNSDGDGYRETIEGTPQDNQLGILYRTIKTALGPNRSHWPIWNLAKFHWESSAATGSSASVDAFLNAQLAAQSGAVSAESLKLLLLNKFPKLRRVHLIAHSAGTWVLYNTILKLLQAQPNLQYQVTLLDPYIPASLNLIIYPPGLTPFARDNNLSKELISSLTNLFPKCHRLENYYVTDATDSFGPVTSEVFNWNVSGLTENDHFQQIRVQSYGVDLHLPLVGISVYGHNNMIRFFSDTINFVTGTYADFEPYRSLQPGWRKSLYYLGPAFSQQPQNLTVQAGSSASFSASPYQRGIGNSTPVGLTTRWQKSLPGSSDWSDIANSSSTTLTVPGVTSSMSGTRYRALASLDRIIDEPSDAATLLVDSAPVAQVPARPAGFRALPSGLGAVNLSWTRLISSQTGFQLKRRLTGTNNSFLPVSQPGREATTYTDTGLAAFTDYEYSLEALNAVGPSTAAITTVLTLASPSVQYSLLIGAVAGSDGRELALSVPTWTGTGAALQTQVTPFSRSEPGLTPISASAPLTAPGGLAFAYWVVNGEQRVNLQTIPTTVPLARSIKAVYLPSATTRTLVEIIVTGPPTVNERNTGQFSCRANYSDGTSASVTPSWACSSALASISAAGVLSAGAVSTDSTVQVLAQYSEGGINRSAQQAVTIRNIQTSTTYSLTRAVVGSGEIRANPTGSLYAAGSEVRLHAIPSSGQVFSHWSGDGTGSNRDLTVIMDRNKSVSANFTADTSIGSLQVNISPAQANAEGAGWKFDNFTAFRPSGDTQTNISPRTNKYVSFKEIPGWIKPEQIRTSITGGQTTTLSATYTEILGSVQVTILPVEATQAGAMWRLDGGSWQASGIALANVSPGQHVVEYSSISGWSTPPGQTVTVTRGFTATATVEYPPPAGVPIVTSIAPRTGPLVGGTVVTIEGANFQPGATVTFGGVAATSVNVVSTTRVTAVTPARASYGTVPFSLTSGGQTVTLLSGFSYLEPMGENMALIGQIGGSVEAVALSGTLLAYGEGPGLVLADITNPSSPLERGRIALPRVVRDIAISGSTAYVAVGGAGVYAIDISNPTAPLIVGFYDTPGSAGGVSVAGTLAYVADGPNGLLILNVGDPTAMTRAGGVVTGGGATRVAVGSIAGKTYAFLAESYVSPGNPALRVVDASVPGNPQVVATVSASSLSGYSDLKLVGTKLYAADWSFGVRIFNASNPVAMIQTGSFSSVAGSFIDVSGSRLGACSGDLRLGDANATNPSIQGQISLGSICRSLRVTDTLAVAAMGTAGVKLVSISTPSAPTLRSTVPTIALVEDVWVDGSFAYLACETGMQVANISNPARPTRFGSFASGASTDLVIIGGKAVLAYTGNEPPVRVVDISAPNAPILQGTYAGSFTRNVAPWNGYAVLAAATDRSAPRAKIDILNISNPSNPTSAGSIVLSTINAGVDAVATNGDYIFAGRSGQGVDIVRATNPAAMMKTATISLSRNFSEIAVSGDGNVLYVPGDSIQLVNVSDKANPMLGPVLDLTPETTTAGYTSVYVSGNKLYTEESGIVYVLDITDPLSPQRIASYSIPGSARGFHVVGDLVYVAGYSAGMTVLRLLDIKAPGVTITGPSATGTYTTTAGSIVLAGSAQDEVGVTRVIWENSRGGGGVASGTNAWSASVQLQEGVNILTVTAEDSAGNRGTTSLTVTAAFPDVVAPSLSVTGPTVGPNFVTDQALVSITGSAADSRGVTAILWTDSNGHSGNATRNGNAWEITGATLEMGANVFAIEARDAAGNSTLRTVTILRLAAGAQPPTVTIRFPTEANEFTTSQSSLNLSGEAGDDRSVARLTWRNDRGGSGEIAPTAIWALNNVGLQLGLNVITVTAEDDSGNISEGSLAVTLVDPPLPTPTNTPLPTNTPNPTATPTPGPGTTNLVNLSTRLRVSTGDNIGIAGFVIANAPKRVLLRVLGPSLAPFGVSDTLNNPSVRLMSGANELARNDSWRTAQQAEVQASGFAPSDDRECAIVATLSPGAYTALVSGEGGTVGVAIVEMYDLETSSAGRLINVSTRGLVQTGESVMIGGFVLGGASPKRVVVRAIGPALGAFGIPNPLVDPSLEIKNAAGVEVARCDNWSACNLSSQLAGYGLAPTQSNESALVLDLAPGAYTALVRGVGDGVGVSLVEVYSVQDSARPPGPAESQLVPKPAPVPKTISTP